jgi:phenylacetate-coenzyme A ligase PaaK-like adenylate-forming protein
MKIIGKLLKKTTEIGYLRQAKKGRDYNDQLETISNLIDKAKQTRFGVRHHFTTILQSEDLVKAYQQNVPVTDYDEFLENWLQGSILGVKDNTWPGRIKYYALSSGTTGSPSKRIPVTEEMIRSFQKSSMRQITILHELDLPDTFFNASVLAVGGCTKLSKMPTHIEGDLSGILKKHTSFILSPFAKPGNKISGIKDWNEKLELMIQKAPEWNIGVIAGVPSWCIMLIEKIVDRYQLNSIHDIWPNLAVYVHGGVFMDPYLPRLEKVTNTPLHLLDTYLASEGYFGYQTSVSRKGMQLLLHTGVFFEFIPFNANYFNENGELKDRSIAYTLDEVKEGVEYALVISTNAGLWRYMIGDLVRFVNVEEREVIITGRIKQYLSLCGEHLSLDNMNQAIASINQTLQLNITEFCIIPDNSESKHHWFLGVDSPVDPKMLMDAIDQKLKEGNDDYAAVRKYTLNDPEITCLPSSMFYEFMDSIGKTGAQNKVPRVMNTHQSELWTTFLKDKNLLK